MPEINPKIALIGYGNMGKELEKIAKNQNITITDIFEINNKIKADEKYDFDVAIDFSSGDSILENVKILAGHKKNIIIGVTNWQKDKYRIFDIINNSGIGMVYGANYSIGMNIFFKLVRLSAQLMNKIEGYDIMIHEIHHSKKKDSPSGTAITLAEIIVQEFDKKKQILKGETQERIEPDMLQISSTRGGEVFGTHTVYIDSLADTLELKHIAKNRIGFAEGALFAAQWIFNKSGIYNFNDII
jgi:4-hydroxy-tetrahydrodipicolinate reductase